VTLVVTPQTPGYELRSTTTAQWVGVYDPPIGSNTAPFTVDYAGANIVIVDSWMARVLIGGGTISNAPNVENVMGGGSLVGTFTLTTPPICLGDADFNNIVNFNDTTIVTANWGMNHGPGNTGPGDANRDSIVNFADITSVQAHWGETCSNTLVQGSTSIALNTNAAEWRQISYPSGFGQAPPTLGPAVASVRIHRNSLYATPSAPPVAQLQMVLGTHHAVIVRAAENADSAALAPATISVDLLALNSIGQVIDREPGLILTKLGSDGDPSSIIHHSDLTRPVIVLDQLVTQTSYPQFTILIGSTTGSVQVVPSSQ
jgi:hypothetical protein